MNIENFIQNKPYLIAGPCSAESEEQMMTTADLISDKINLFRAGIWKPRTNPGSFQGFGEKALDWIKKVKQKKGVKICTEVATPHHVELCLDAGLDALWIGARTTVNPFYVQEIAESLRGVDIPIFVKNPIHPELGLWTGALERFNKVGICKIAAIHRGFFTRESSPYRNDPKWEIPIELKRQNPLLPIICDVSHIAGDVNLIFDIAQVAIDLDMQGLMIETHNNPGLALSDSKQQILPSGLIKILETLVVKRINFENDQFNNNLLLLRNKVDKVDQSIIDFLNDRIDIVKEIATLKQANQITIFQLERWFEILLNTKNQAQKIGLDPKMITEIFEVIHKYSILTQTNIMRK